MTEMTDDVAPDVALQDNTSQRLPCVLVLDASGSMAGTPIKQLNAGVQLLESELKKDDMASQRVQILVIRFGDTVSALGEWADAMDFAAPTLVAGGATPMGAAVRLALQKLEEQKARYNAHGIQYNRPWMFLITDGEPTDHDWQHAAAECRAAEEGKHLTCYAIGVGDDADMAKLAQFSTGPTAKLDGLEFQKLFKWLSNSISAASKAQKGSTVQYDAPSHWMAGQT